MGVPTPQCLKTQPSMCHTRRLLPPLDWFYFLRTPTGEGALGSGGGGGGGGAQRGCAARATEGRVGKTARRGRRRRRRRQRARGARDGGAEQRPLARPLLRLCQGRAAAAASTLRER